MKVNKKSETIVTHLEPKVYQAARLIIDQEDISQSAYVRKCVVKDLVDRGLITKDMLVEMT